MEWKQERNKRQGIWLIMTEIDHDHDHTISISCSGETNKHDHFLLFKRDDFSNIQKKTKQYTCVVHQMDRERGSPNRVIKNKYSLNVINWNFYFL